MSRATLTIEPAPGYPAIRTLTVDCDHGTTTIAVANGTAPDAPQITDAAAARMALLKHYSEERCSCTRRLRERYGLHRRPKN